MEEARGVKFCTRVGLLSGQVFSPFDELWLVRSHGGDGIMSGMSHCSLAQQLDTEVCGHGSRNWGWRHCLRPYGGNCVLQAC